MVQRVFGNSSNLFILSLVLGLVVVGRVYTASVSGHASPSVASPTPKNVLPAPSGHSSPSTSVVSPSSGNISPASSGHSNPSVVSSNSGIISSAANYGRSNTSAVSPSTASFSPLAAPGASAGSSLNNVRALQTPDYCNLMPYTGVCRAYLPSWFYNITTGICELFVYGGCGGNRNRFDTWPTCMAACANPKTVPMPRPITEEDFPPSSIQDTRNTSGGIITVGNGTNELPTLRAATKSWNQLLANLYNTNATGNDHVHDILNNNNDHVSDNHVMSFAPRKLLHT